MPESVDGHELGAAADRAAEQAAHAATRPSWRNPAVRGAALNAVAGALRNNQHVILATAADESGLTHEELRPEFERMVRTLRMFADLIAEGSWVRASIDTARNDAAGAIGPNVDVRRMLVSLDGAVAVFGASNFPLAYGACGGDTASALAAGCGVVVKEHPAHPQTGRMIATLASDALAAAGAAGVLTYARDDERAAFAVAEAVVRSDAVCAVGFTGSRAGGLAIEKLAQERERPIPVFAEMSSVNVVCVTAAAMRERGEEIGDLIGRSLLARYGQQCTCPGIVLLDDPAELHKSVTDPLAALVRRQPSRRMLSKRVRTGFVESASKVGSFVPDVDVLAEGEKDSRELHAPALLFTTDWKSLRGPEFMTEEMFGPAAIVGGMPLTTELGLGMLDEVLGKLGGQLTASLFIGRAEESSLEIRALADRLRSLAGRVIFNGIPTGVRVCTSMVHGGPYPATNRPDTTAVGPLAIERWCRPVCFQNCPDALLPDELKDANPRGVLRTVNGALTRDAARRV